MFSCLTLLFVLIEQLSPNIALEGSATQSSNFENNHFAKYAIDGIFTTDLITLGQCTHTNKDAGAWWQVEFTDIYTMQKVAITIRKSSGKTLTLLKSHAC